MGTAKKTDLFRQALLSLSRRHDSDDGAEQDEVDRVMDRIAGYLEWMVIPRYGGLRTQPSLIVKSHTVSLLRRLSRSASITGKLAFAESLFAYGLALWMSDQPNNGPPVLEESIGLLSVLGRTETRDILMFSGVYSAFQRRVNKSLLAENIWRECVRISRKAFLTSETPLSTIYHATLDNYIAALFRLSDHILEQSPDKALQLVEVAVSSVRLFPSSRNWNDETLLMVALSKLGNLHSENDDSKKRPRLPRSG